LLFPAAANFRERAFFRWCGILNFGFWGLGFGVLTSGFGVLSMDFGLRFQFCFHELSILYL
jgi:hypothetical protein